MISNRGIVLLIDEVNERWLRTMKKMDLNVLGIHEIVGEQPTSVDKILSRLEDPEFQKLIERFNESGITVEYELHALEWLLPRDLFDQSPNLFRMDTNGNRIREQNCCASSKEALRIISERAYLLATKLRCKSHNYYFWMDDAIGATCKCNDCIKYSGSDQNMIIMKSILSGIKRYDPNAKLAYLAYADALDVPTIAPGEDMFLEFAPFKRNHKLAMSENDKKNTNYRELLLKLLHVFSPKDTHILEYWTDNSLFSGHKKPPKRLEFANDVMAKDVMLYKSLGIDFITAFACFLGEDYVELYGEPEINDYGKNLQA